MSTCARARASRIRWSADEDELIREYLPEHSSKWPQWGTLLPGRTPAAIKNRGITLGVPGVKANQNNKKKSAPATGTPWTEEQREALVRNAMKCVEETGHSLYECAKELAWIHKVVKINTGDA